MPKYLVQPWDNADDAVNLYAPSPNKAALQFANLEDHKPINLFVKDMDDGQVVHVQIALQVTVLPIAKHKGDNE